MNIGDRIVVAKDFHNDPGAREENDGEHSGEIFLREILKPKFLLARAKGYILQIDLDGVHGYPSSFVSGSFGALSIEYGAETVLKYLDFKSDRRPIRIDKIRQEIEQPEKNRK